MIRIWKFEEIVCRLYETPLILHGFTKQMCSCGWNPIVTNRIKEFKVNGCSFVKGIGNLNSYTFIPLRWPKVTIVISGRFPSTVTDSTLVDSTLVDSTLVDSTLADHYNSLNLLLRRPKMTILPWQVPLNSDKFYSGRFYSGRFYSGRFYSGRFYSDRFISCRTCQSKIVVFGRLSSRLNEL